MLGVENDDDHVYLVSQLVEGERLDRSGLADDQAVRAIAAVCDALAYAHSRGIVHRDVKPANILVARDGTVTLTDFGIASDEDSRDQTVDERVLGTLSYMSPEQASGTQTTGATDVWAAGLTLYTQLTGTTRTRQRRSRSFSRSSPRGPSRSRTSGPTCQRASAGPSTARSSTIRHGGPMRARCATGCCAGSPRPRRGRAR